MIIALTNSKGGVGKSTIAVHLTVWWRDCGGRVGLVDADAQGSSSCWLREAAPDIAVFRLQTPDEILDQLPKLAAEFEHLVIDGPAGLSEVTRAILLVADLALLPCGPSLLDLRAATSLERDRDGGAVVHEMLQFYGREFAALAETRLSVSCQIRVSHGFLELQFVKWFTRGSGFDDCAARPCRAGCLGGARRVGRRRRE